ncbi:MAG TPA: hypothetical protein VFP80_02735 [Thermoanaerobaculia bacterium]|nr:hypothetical protein [Thermoanaerobaculia bacterium]
MRHLLAIALLLLAPVTFAVDLPVAPRETGAGLRPNHQPFVVPSGDAFVAVWSTLDLDPPRFVRFRHGGEILAAGDLGLRGRVEAAVAGPDGSVLLAFGDGDGVHIAAIALDGAVRISDPVSILVSSMAWNGSALLFVDRQGRSIVTDANGHVLHQGAQLPLTGYGISSAAPRGDGFVVTWGTDNDLFVTTLLGTGQVAKEERLAGRPSGSSAIGCNPSGTCLLLSAADEPLSGRILGTAPGPLFRISQDVPGKAIQPVWDGQRFVVAWANVSAGEPIVRAEVQVAGVALDGSVTPIATIASPGRNRDTPVLAHANGETVVVWEDATRCGYAGSQIRARSLSTGHELRLSHGLPAQSEPAIAAGATNALVAWTERSGGSHIRARLFPFTAPAFDLSSGAGRAPVVGTDGSGHYLVAWHEWLPDEDCRTALRVRAPGSDTISTLGKDIDAVQVTWNGSEYVVLWEQTDPAQLFAVRVDRSGVPIDPAPIALSTAEQEGVNVAIDHEPAGLFRTGNGYLLVWRRLWRLIVPVYPPSYPPQADIRTTVLGPQLVPAGAPQMQGPASWQSFLAAAMKGTTIVALWKLGENTLHAVRLNPDGTVLADRDLGINAAPLRVVPTRTGYTVQTGSERVLLDDDLAVIERRPAEASGPIAETPGGLAEVYLRDESLFLHWPERRRRTMR